MLMKLGVSDIWARVYKADFEYLHKLCQLGAVELFQSRGSSSLSLALGLN